MSEATQLNINLPATTDLSTSQYCAVATDASGGVSMAVNRCNADGVLQNKPAQDVDACVTVAGVTSCHISGDVDDGDVLQVADDGALMTADYGIVVARALMAGADGDVITVALVKSNADYLTAPVDPNAPPQA